MQGVARPKAFTDAPMRLKKSLTEKGGDMRISMSRLIRYFVFKNITKEKTGA